MTFARFIMMVLAGADHSSGGGGGLDPSAAILALSPAGYWKLDDASGSAVDSSGNGRHGTVSGASYQATLGPDGASYMSFDGSNDGVQVADNNAWSVTSSGTGMSVFFIAQSVSPNGNLMGKETTSNGEWIIQVGASTLNASTRTSGLSTIRGRSITVTWGAGVWVVGCVVFPHAVTTHPDVYYNGTQPSGSASGSQTTYTNGTAPLEFGGVARLPSSFRFAGTLAHVAIFPTALNSTQVGTLMTATQGWWS